MQDGDAWIESRRRRSSRNNFGISGGGLGMIRALGLFGALVLAFTVFVTPVVRAGRGRYDAPAQPATEGDRRAPEAN